MPSVISICEKAQTIGGQENARTVRMIVFFITCKNHLDHYHSVSGSNNYIHLLHSIYIQVILKSIENRTITFHFEGD